MPECDPNKFFLYFDSSLSEINTKVVYDVGMDNIITLNFDLSSVTVQSDYVSYTGERHELDL